MALETWYKTTTPRKEVREGRSFNPDEFAIALEQVVAGTAPEDYRDPAQFFARTCFTRALRDHAGMVLRRLDGKTENTAPVLTLVTQFGGGKTHTLTTLYHIARHGEVLYRNPETGDMLSQAELPVVENVRVATFVGNAWDPREGRETPWLDLARQLAGDAGVAALGAAAKTTPPGTESLLDVFRLAGGPVLILMDEVLNFFNRHRNLAEPAYAFFDNLYRAMTGTTHGAVVVSLPRSQVEMTDWDVQWQERITKVTRRVARDLIANDEAEIAEVVRRRLFEDLGSERVRKSVSKAFADWCFERRNQLPHEWTAVDTATTEAKARDYLHSRFEACYPFHPATLSVFQRKWQALSQYQQTRGTLAMLAQWISTAHAQQHKEALNEPLISLGRAPLDRPDFRAVVLGQLGESRLQAAIEADIAGAHSHARALDVDTKGALRDIHRRVATAILFESSGGQVDKLAHLPELRFAVGTPELDTTSIDSAAGQLEARAFFIRRVGTDGYRIGYRPTLKKIVADRRQSLDEEGELRPEMRRIVQSEFERGAKAPLALFPEDSSAIQDTPRLTLVVLSPAVEWDGSAHLRTQIAEWTHYRGKSPRLYPGALVWCMRKAGRELRDRVSEVLAWRRVSRESAEGLLGDIEPGERVELKACLTEAEQAAKDEVWGQYRYVALADSKEPDKLRVIDLGAAHATGSETLTERVLGALRGESLLNESVGAGYLDRHWPRALKESGSWPLKGLRQSFLDGSLTRLTDPDRILKARIAEFVEAGQFALGSEQQPDGTFKRLWYQELLAPDEIEFESDVYLVRPEKAQGLLEPVEEPSMESSEDAQPGEASSAASSDLRSEAPGHQAPATPEQDAYIVVQGSFPSELWNRVGRTVIPKLRSGDGLDVEVRLKTKLSQDRAGHLKTELQQAIADLELTGKMEVVDSE